VRVGLDDCREESERMQVDRQHPAPTTTADNESSRHGCIATRSR
jgi:hypothetical protein